MDRDESFLSGDGPGRSMSRLSLNSSQNGKYVQNGRQFAKLDPPRVKKTEYTTFYTQQTSSRGGLHDSHMLHTSSSSAHPGSTVIDAFRDLQRKVKAMEEERYQATQIRDDLKARLALERRNQAVERSKKEYDTAESLLDLRSQVEARKRERDDVAARLRTSEEVSESISRKISAQQGLIGSLQEDVDRNRARVLAAEKAKLSLSKDLRALRFRTEELDIVNASSPQKAASQRDRVQLSIAALESKVTKLRRRGVRSSAHIASLGAYADLLVRINGDLVDTLHTREMVKRDFVKAARALSPPPRYAWPKEVSVGNLTELLQNAVEAQAQAVADSATLQATETAMQSIVQALSPQRTSSGVHSSAKKAASPSTSSAARKRMTFTDLEEAPAAHTAEEVLLSDSSSDEDYAPPRRCRKKRAAAPKVPPKAVSRRQGVLSKVLARQSAVTNATRLAAAATAASTTLRVNAAPRNTNSNRRPASAPAAAGEASSRVNFIPTSSGVAPEFNIIASVSKASRATSQLNATIASRVKSLQRGGAGQLYGGSEVPRITIMDLQHKLAAAKRKIV